MRAHSQFDKNYSWVIWARIFDRCHELRLSRVEFVLANHRTLNAHVISDNGAAVTTQVNLSLSFLSRVSKHLIEFIAHRELIDSMVFRLVENILSSSLYC